jgi:hypothetical protein
VSSFRWSHPLSWATRVLIWTAPSRNVSGIPVTITSRSPQRLESLFRKVADGLDVLRQYHPRGYRTVRRQVRRVLVGFLPNAKATWWGPPRACMLSMEYFSNDSATPTDVALSLLHEATHGRLEGLGFRYTPEKRLRLETICTRAEMDLAERLPDRNTRLPALDESLHHLASLYSSENLQAGRVGGLRELGAPSWVVRAVEWLNRSAA